ncbi:MAG TPA: hypothetical protein VGD57_00570 [Candidatus Dormibacteraeota bacterium]|jgi:hypothetical protein
MDPKIVLLSRLSAALTRGQGGFTEDDLAVAFKEVYGLLMQGQIGNLVVEEELNLTISDGEILYSRATKGTGPEEAMPLETLIENMRSAEGQ